MGLLRILLAVCVYSAHSRPIGHLRWLNGGVALELFFVVSGFYMQLVLSTKYTKGKLGKAWVSQFYKARYSRLLPIYLLTCGIVIGAALLRPSLAPVPVWSYVRGLPDTPGKLLFEGFLCFTNATMLFQDVTMYLAAHSGHIHWSANFWNSEMPLWQGLAIPQAWSLGVELTFYLIAPYVLNLRSRWLILGTCCGLAVKLIAIHALHLRDPWSYRFFPFEAGYFLLGALAFRYRARLDRLLPKRIESYCVYALAIGFAAFRLPVPVPFLTYPIAFAVAIPFMFRVTSGFTADRLLGELSYPFYLFHVFALTLAGGASRRWWPGAEDSIAQVGLVLTLVLSAIALVLEIRFVEPWRSRLAERHTSRL